MEHFILAVHDRQLSAYMRPFTAASLGQATRSFRDEVNRKESELNKHPEDYSLVQLGTFNEQTGNVSGLANPLVLTLATNVLENT